MQRDRSRTAEDFEPEEEALEEALIREWGLSGYEAEIVRTRFDLPEHSIRKHLCDAMVLMRRQMEEERTDPTPGRFRSLVQMIDKVLEVMRTL